jgi:hypothetical protein
MAKPWDGGRRTCESCIGIDVNAWHSGGYLRPGDIFSWKWPHQVGARPYGIGWATDDP